MVEAQQVCSTLRRVAFGVAIVLRTHTKSASGAFFGGVRQRVDAEDDSVAPDERTTAFVRIGLRSMLSDGRRDARLEYERRHQRLSRASGGA
jgi:hypothetical protein